MTWTWVLLMLMVRLIFFLHSCTLSTRICKSFSDGARRTISSANLELLMIWPWIFMPTSTSSIARQRTSSRKMINSWGERLHPCPTPVWVILIYSSLLKCPFPEQIYKDRKSMVGICWCTVQMVLNTVISSVHYIVTSNYLARFLTFVSTSETFSHLKHV